MTIDKQALRNSALEMISVLGYIASFESEEIDGDDLDLRFETEGGFDTGCTISITSQCQDAADVMQQLLNELEATAKQNAEDVQIKARLCRESNSLHDRLREAEKRIAELEAILSNKLPGGFSLDDAKELHTNLVNSHISKAISGERMKLATRNTDLAWIKTQLVSAAWFVQASIEAHSAAGISIKGSE